jgi:hypothetical protein
MEDLPDSGKVDEEYLFRLRKKLLLEFNLGNSSTIQINGQSYSKDEIIKIIDLLLNDTLMPTHIFIFNNKRLLDFLENNDSKVGPGKLGLVEFPEEIATELEPLLRDRINGGMKRAMDMGDFEGALKLKEEILLLPDPDLYDVTDTIHTQLLRLIEKVRAKRADNCGNIDKELSFLEKKALAEFLNVLPPEFIDTVTSVVSNILYAMTDYSQHANYNRKYLLSVCEMLLLVNCNSTWSAMVLMLYNKVKSGHAFPGSNSKQSQSSGNSKWTEFAVYGGLLLLVILLKIGLGGGDKSSSYKYNTGFDSEQLDRMQKNMEALTQSLKYMDQIKSNPLYGDPLSAEVNKVLLTNKTGVEFLLISSRPGIVTTESYSFPNGKTDTLKFGSNDFFMIYCMDAQRSKSVEKVLYKKYTIQMKKYWMEGEKLPVIKLDKKFISRKKFENDKVKFSSE